MLIIVCFAKQVVDDMGLVPQELSDQKINCQLPRAYARLHQRKKQIV